MTQMPPPHLLPRLAVTSLSALPLCARTYSVLGCLLERLWLLYFACVFPSNSGVQAWTAESLVPRAIAAEVRVHVLSLSLSLFKRVFTHCVWCCMCIHSAGYAAERVSGVTQLWASDTKGYGFPMCTRGCAVGPVRPVAV